MAGLFDVGGLMGPLAPGMSGFVNPLAMAFGGFASDDPTAALARMGQMQEAAARLQADQQYRQERMDLLREQETREAEAMRVKQQHDEAMRSAQLTAARTMFPGLPETAVQAVAPQLMQNYAQEYVRQQFAQPGEGPERRMEKDVAGMWRYVDTGERVFPGIEAPAEPGEALPKFGEVSGLRKEFEAQAKPFQATKESYSRIMDAPATGAGDTSLIYAFAKLQDPRGVVTDADARAAIASGGVSGQLMGYWNQLQGQGKLDEKTRAEIREVADITIRRRAREQAGVQERYTGLAESRGFNPKNVVRDLVDPKWLEPRQAIEVTEETTEAADLGPLPSDLQSRVDRLLQSAPGGVPPVTGTPSRTLQERIQEYQQAGQMGRRMPMSF